MPPQVNNNNSSKSNNISSGKVRTAANTLHLHGGVQPQAEQQQRRLGTTPSSGGGRSSSMNMFAIQDREEVSTRTTSARTTAAAATATTSTRIKRVIATNTSSINTNNNNNVGSSSSRKRTTTITVAPASYKTPTYQGATSTISVSRNSTRLRGNPVVVRLADTRRGEGGSKSGPGGVNINIPNLDGNVTDEDDEDEEGGGGSDEDDPIKLSEEERSRAAQGRGGMPPLLPSGPNSDPTPESSRVASTGGATVTTSASTTEAAPLNCATSPQLAFPPKAPSTPPRPTTPKKPVGGGGGGVGGGRAMSHSIASLLGVDDNDDNVKEEEESHQTRSGAAGQSSTAVNSRPSSSPSSATTATVAAAAPPHPVVPTSGKESVRTHLATPPPAPVVPSDRPLALTTKGAAEEEKEEEQEEEAMDLSGGSDKLKNEGGAVNDDGSVALDLCTKRTQKESDDEKAMSVEAQTVVQNEMSSIAGVSGSADGEKDTQEQCKDGDASVRPPDDEDGDICSGEQKEVPEAESMALAADLDCKPGEVEEKLRDEAVREGTSAIGDQLGKDNLDVAKTKDKSETVEVSRVEEDIRMGTNIVSVEGDNTLEPTSPTKSEAEAESGKVDEPVPESFQRQISSPAEKAANELRNNLDCKEGDDKSELESRTTSNPPESPTLRHEGPEEEKVSAKSEGQHAEDSLTERSHEPAAQIGRVTETTKPLRETEHSELEHDPQPSEEAVSEGIDTAQRQSDPETVEKYESVHKKADSKAETMSEHVAPSPTPCESESPCQPELEEEDEMPKSPLVSASAPSLVPKSIGSQLPDSKPEATGDPSEPVESADSASVKEVKPEVDGKQEPALPQQDFPKVAANAETNDLPEKTAGDTGKDDVVASSSAISTKKESGSDAQREITSNVSEYSESAAHNSDLPDVRVDTSQKEDPDSKAAESPDQKEPSEVTNKPCNDNEIMSEKGEPIAGVDNSLPTKSPAPLDSQTPKDPLPSPFKQTQGKDDDRDGKEDDEKRVGCIESGDAGQIKVSEKPQKDRPREEKPNSPTHEKVGENIVGEEKLGQVAEDSQERAVEHAAEKQEATKSKVEVDEERDQLAMCDDIVKATHETSGRSVTAEPSIESTEKASSCKSLERSKSPPRSETNLNANVEESMEDTGDGISTESSSAAQRDAEPKTTTTTVVPEQGKVAEKDAVEKMGETPSSDTSKPEPSPKPVVIKLGSNYLSKNTSSSETSSSSSPPSGLTISGQTVIIPRIKPSSPTPQSQPISTVGEKASSPSVNLSPTVRLVNIGGQVRISKALPTDEKEAKGSSPPPPPISAAPAKTVVNAETPTAAPSKFCDTVSPAAATPSSASPKKPSRASTVSPSPQLSSDSESEDDDEGDDEDEDDDDDHEEEEDEDDSLSTSSSVTSKTAAPSANSTQSTSSVNSSNEIVMAPQRLSPNLLTAHLPSMHKTSKRLFACNVCGKECRNESDLSLHKKRHKVDQPFVCQFCDREYVDKSR